MTDLLISGYNRAGDFDTDTDTQGDDMTTDTATRYEIETEQVKDGDQTYTRYDILDDERQMIASTYGDEELAERIKRMIEKANAGNAIMTLRPYRWGKMWVFDDAAVGLRKEPFVAGVPEIIEDLLAEHGIDGDDGFYLTFSATPFPGYQRELVWIESQHGGNWYDTEMSDGSYAEGWLCPALFKYYEDAPEFLYAKVEPRAEGEVIKPDEPEPALGSSFFQGIANLGRALGVMPQDGEDMDDPDKPFGL